MRLDIRYRMHFRYAEAVSESQNEVRMRPRDDACQRVLSYRLTAYPPVQVLQACDYWGTAVDHLGVRTPHTELELEAEASVETAPRPAMTGTPAVEALAERGFRSERFEFLEPSEHVWWNSGDAVSRRAATAAREAASVPALVASVVEEVRRSLRYEAGSTEIGVPLADLLAGGAGVCQDFAHLAIGMLRCVGVPARYVSGYLFAADETETVAADGGGWRAAGATDAAEGATLRAEDEQPAADAGESHVVSVQTHAWIEAAIPGSGWWALDPTNGGGAGERHVVIGHGRDYGDVPPVRGAFMGPGSADVDAEVVIGRQVTGPPGAFAKPHGPHPVTVQAPAAAPRRPPRDQQQQ